MTHRGPSAEAKCSAVMVQDCQERAQPAALDNRSFINSTLTQDAVCAKVFGVFQG